MPLYDDQVARMKELMRTGSINEDKKNDFNINIVEYHVLGPDGKTYGIIKEGTKYYIKVAPKKDTDVVAEDYDYIGGFQNKKRYEYDSYSNASKNLELKLMSVKESICSNNTVCEAYDPYKKMDVMIEQTEAMKSEINRQREIMRNVSLLMNEEATIGIKNTGLPEAPKTSSKTDSQNAPYMVKASAKLDKDNVESSSDYKKKAPFDEDGEVSDADMESDKSPKCSGKSCDKNAPHTEEAKYVPDNSVANQKPKGGKCVKVNESKKHVIRMTEEQVLAWSNNKDYMDTSTETTIGDSDPFIDNAPCECGNKCSHIDEDAAMINQEDNINSPVPGNGEIGDGDPFEENVSEDADNADYSNYAGFDDRDFDDEWESWLNDGDNVEDVSQQEEYEDEYGNIHDEKDDYITDFNGKPIEKKVVDTVEFESKKSKGANIKEDKLDTFGKTPGYRKKPMTLPPNVEVAPNGYEDWNDKSVENEEPFGQQIGSSAPYTELVQQITNAIVTAISKNAIKKKA